MCIMVFIDVHTGCGVWASLMLFFMFQPVIQIVRIGSVILKLANVIPAKMVILDLNVRIVSECLSQQLDIVTSACQMLCNY